MSTQERQDARAVVERRCEQIRDRVTDLLEPSATRETSWVRVHAGACPEPDPVVCDRCEHVEGEHAAVAELGCATEGCGCVGFLPPRRFRWQVRCADCGELLPEGAGQRLVSRPWPVDHPSLLDQLEVLIEGSTAGTSGGGFESRPAANIAALDSLMILERESAIWARKAGLRSGDVRARLLLLVERAPTFDETLLRDFGYDVLRWWARARIVTTWDTAPIKVFAPCMNCDRRGGLQVRLDPMSAVCLHCDAAWDRSTIGLLGEHIRIALDAEPSRSPSTAGQVGA